MERFDHDTFLHGLEHCEDICQEGMMRGEGLKGPKIDLVPVRFILQNGEEDYFFRSAFATGISRKSGQDCCRIQVVRFKNY